MGDGYDPAAGTVPAEGDLQVELRSNVVSGVVLDDQGKPLAGVRVFVDGTQQVARTGGDGSYRLPNVPEDGTLVYKMPGFRLVELPLDGADDQGRRPAAVRRARPVRAGCRLRGPGPAGRDAGPHRPDRGQCHGHRRQGDRRLGVLRDRPPRGGAVRRRSTAHLRPGGAAAEAQGARHLHHRPHGVHEGQHRRRVTARAGGAQLGHRRAVARQPRRHLARSRSAGRGRVPRGDRGRPGRQGLRRGAARLHPLLQ